MLLSPQTLSWVVRVGVSHRRRGERQLPAVARERRGGRELIAQTAGQLAHACGASTRGSTPVVSECVWHTRRSAQREVCGQLLACVVEALIERPTSGVELDREGCGRNAVDRDCDQNSSLTRCQLLSDQVADVPE